MLVVSAMNDVKWKYALRGTSQCLMSNTAFRFSVTARQYLNQELVFNLEGLTGKNLKNEVFALHVDDVLMLIKDSRGVPAVGLKEHKFLQHQEQPENG